VKQYINVHGLISRGNNNCFMRVVLSQCENFSAIKFQNSIHFDGMGFGDRE